MTDDYYSLSVTTSVTFSRHPGQLTQGVIDFGSKPGWNHWKMATQKLQDDLYDCKPEGFYQFTRNQKKTKVQKPEWMFQKPKDADLRRPREWNGATWHYCSPETGGKCHGLYRVHKPSECRSKGQSQGNGGERKGKNIKSHEVTISEALSELNGNGYESE